ncbi:unnamed protein product [Tetraodon nigroviridis]|uniref:(spotted green pufferfish) hypothetical protein n=1 Tax=Tetraodon nigroviridis TaxID=99883 RepID=Q4S5K6_TETNG|nr:unnamed protein product [Tetraodon nigroviridis]
MAQTLPGSISPFWLLKTLLSILPQQALSGNYRHEWRFNDAHINLA